MTTMPDCAGADRRRRFRPKRTSANLVSMTRNLASRALLCALPFALVACATPVQPADQPPQNSAILVPDETTPPVPPAAPVVSNAQPLAVAVPEFVRTTSAKYDVDATYVADVIKNAQMRESIIKAMSRPAEAKPWKDYRPIFISQQRIDA